MTEHSASGPRPPRGHAQKPADPRAPTEALIRSQDTEVLRGVAASPKLT